MKGRQYQGRIFPGPSALILETLAAPVGKVVAEESSETTPQLKVVGMTDEFVRCVQQEGSALDRLSGILEEGNEDIAAAATIRSVSDKKLAGSTSKSKRSSRKTK